MAHDTLKSHGQQTADVHISSDPAIRDYVTGLRKGTASYAMGLKETRAAIDAALGQKSLTDALYRMRRDEDAV